MDGLGGQQSGNVFAAIADLAKEVGIAQAGMSDKVSFQQLMARDTEARRELNGRLDSMENHLTGNFNLSLTTLQTKIDNLASSIATVTADTKTQQTQNHPSRDNRTGRDIVTASIGIAIAILGIYLLKQAGVEMP